MADIYTIIIIIMHKELEQWSGNTKLTPKLQNLPAFSRTRFRADNEGFQSSTGLAEAGPLQIFKHIRSHGGIDMYQSKNKFLFIYVSASISWITSTKITKWSVTHQPHFPIFHFRADDTLYKQKHTAVQIIIQAASITQKWQRKHTENLVIHTFQKETNPCNCFPQVHRGGMLNTLISTYWHAWNEHCICGTMNIVCVLA